MKRKPLISIGEAAKLMHISIDTLRRWDNEKRFPAIRQSGKRFYRATDIEKYLAKMTIAEADIFEAAKNWAMSNSPAEPDSLFYCKDSAIFQYRLNKLENSLGEIGELKNMFPLITSIAGEIGNNSFDHNLGNWPDIPGIFFGYDLDRREVVLADRGQGILTTLKRVRDRLSSDEEALRVAFTEILSGRPKEARGNGLKFVKYVVVENDIKLLFQTGKARLELEKGDQFLNISKTDNYIRGCMALIKF
jgi:hypothetical protein